MKKKTRIKKIISGGQNGVDRSALDFSIQFNIPHAGWCPKGRQAEDGKIPNKYKLTETVEELPKYRTLKNVLNSDGTLIIYNITKDEGTLKTIEFLKKYAKPFYEISIGNGYSKEDFYYWIKSNNISIINIAGPRESKEIGIYNMSFKLLQNLFD